MKLTDAQISQAMQLLGLSQGDFQAVQRAPSFEVAQQRLTELKERAKKGFRKVALVLHPDRTNNDPDKTEAFKLVAAVVDDIEKLNFSAPQPPPPQMRPMRVVFVRMHVNHGFSTSASTTSTTYYGNGWGF
jgi:hypothetical protein